MIPESLRGELGSARGPGGALTRPGTTYHAAAPYSADLRPTRVSSAQLDTQSQAMTVTLKSSDRYSTVVPGSAQGGLLAQLSRQGAQESVTRGNRRSSVLLSFLLGFALPLLLFVALFVWIGRWARRGPVGLRSFSQAKARRVEPNPASDRVTFTDVAGAVEAVEELEEIQEFLADPRRFAAVGARIPKGVLLCGPPGTGKTLLARAVAWEAGWPFFSISGSDFVEMFVGVGASACATCSRRHGRAHPATRESDPDTIPLAANTRDTTCAAVASRIRAVTGLVAARLHVGRGR